MMMPTIIDVQSISDSAGCGCVLTLAGSCSGMWNSLARSGLFLAPAFGGRLIHLIDSVGTRPAGGPANHRNFGGATAAEFASASWSKSRLVLGLLNRTALPQTNALQDVELVLYDVGSLFPACRPTRLGRWRSGRARAARPADAAGFGACPRADRQSDRDDVRGGAGRRQPQCEPAGDLRGA